MKLIVYIVFYFILIYFIAHNISEIMLYGGTTRNYIFAAFECVIMLMYSGLIAMTIDERKLK